MTRTLMLAMVLVLTTTAFAITEPTGRGTGQERVPPKVLERVSPEYTPEEREKGTEGRVVIETMIRADGTVEPLRVVRSLGAALDDQAWKALEQWTFEPGTENGRPVDVRLRIDLFFTLDSDGESPGPTP
jgi:protein TonB